MSITIEFGKRFAMLAEPHDCLGRRFVQQLAAGMDAACSRLGVAALPSPEICAAAGDEVIRLRLAGRVRRCPEVVARGVSDHFLRQEPGPPVPGWDWPEEVLSCLRGEDLAPAQAAVDALAAIAVYIVEGAVDALIGLEQVRHFAAAAAAAAIPSPLPPARLAAVLGTVLSLGVAIRDGPRLMKVIADAVARGLADADVAEIVAARQRSRRIRIEASPEYFEHVAGLFLEDAIAVHDSAVPDVLREPFSLMTDGLFYELGVRIPEIELAATEDLNGHRVRIMVGDAAPSLRVGLPPDHLLCDEPAKALADRGIAAVAAANPANGRECAIIAARDRDATSSYSWDLAGYLVLMTAAELRRQAPLLVDVDSVEREMAALHTAFPALVLAALERMTVGHLARVMRLLLREQIGIRNLRAILETLLATNLFDSTHRRDRLSDADHHAAEVRAAMPQHVAQAYMQNGTLPVHLLDTELERELEALIDLERKAPIDRESGASDVNESDLEARREGVRAVVAGALGPPGEHAPVILTRVAIRLRLSRLMADQRPDIAVLGFEELTPSINILPLTTISLAKVSGFAEVGKALQ